MMMMGRDMLLKGELVERTLTLVGVKTEAQRHDAARRARRAPSRAAPPPAPAKPIVVTLQEDGTHRRRDDDQHGPGEVDRREAEERRRRVRRVSVGPVAREVLKGMGATVALPFLDAMIPRAFAPRRFGETGSPLRLVCIEQVHGAAGSSIYGAQQNLWAPAATGRDFDLVADEPASRSSRFAITSRSSATPTCRAPIRPKRARSAAITSARARPT